jgi:hypothetical protein
MSADTALFDQFLFPNEGIEEREGLEGVDQFFLFDDLYDDEDDEDDEDYEEDDDEDDEEGDQPGYAHGEPLSRAGCSDRFAEVTISGDRRFEKLFMDYCKAARAEGKLDRNDLRDTIITYPRVRDFILYLSSLVKQDGSKRFRYPHRISSALRSWAGRHYWCGGNPEGIMFGDKEHYLPKNIRYMIQQRVKHIYNGDPEWQAQLKKDQRMPVYFADVLLGIQERHPMCPVVG